MPTNETLMQDMISQLYNLWMQAETPTTARHYHNVHDMALKRLESLRKDGKIVKVKESEGDCPICENPWADPSSGAYSFCCDCAVRVHDSCKISWYSSKNVETRRCAFCKGEDELFLRDADFWGGRWRRQQLLEEGKIVKCEYRLPWDTQIARRPGGGALAEGWFWTDDHRYNLNAIGQTGIAHLPRVKISSLAGKDDEKRFYSDYVC